MVNFDKLQNWSGINIDSDIEKVQDIQNELPATANETTGGLFGVIVLSAIYFFLLYTFTREDWLFRYSIDKASLISSAIVCSIGVMGVLTGIFDNWRHVTIFGVIFFISAIVVFLRNNT
jgi:hypothetical protein